VGVGRNPVPESLHADLAAAQALVFGSLARARPSTAGLLSLLDSDWPMRVYDVNLRAPFYSLERVLLLAGWRTLSMHEAEARELCGADENEQPDRLARRLATPRTRAGFASPSASAARGVPRPLRPPAGGGPARQAVDTVGAGDAFLAAMVAGS
jgi:fructokinase